MCRIENELLLRRRGGCAKVFRDRKVREEKVIYIRIIAANAA
jgi:hypothetical protein